MKLLNVRKSFKKIVDLSNQIAKGKGHISEEQRANLDQYLVDLGWDITNLENDISKLGRRS